MAELLEKSSDLWRDAKKNWLAQGLHSLAHWDDAADKATTSLSVRLTEKEKALIAEAAESRGESPTRFIKSSALTQAAHVLNTRKKTSFDFDTVARRVGDLCFKD